MRLIGELDRAMQQNNDTIQNRVSPHRNRTEDGATWKKKRNKLHKVILCVRCYDVVSGVYVIQSPVVYVSDVWRHWRAFL
jgi:hypothetical protein